MSKAAFNRERKELLHAVSEMDGVFYLAPVSDEKIKQAEMELQLKFADEYVYYAQNYGVIIGDGISLTGITDLEPYSVVNKTLMAREDNHYLPHGMYVVDYFEDLKMYILQDRYGAIYSMYRFEQRFMQINANLREYLQDNYYPAVSD